MYSIRRLILACISLHPPTYSRALSQYTHPPLFLFHSVTHGVVCLATGLWRAEYCRACTRQQKEDGVVCSKWRDDLYVEVLRCSNRPHSRFLSLSGASITNSLSLF